MKRLLSWLLALVMIISCLPMSAIPAFAAEEAPEVEGTSTTDPDFGVDFGGELVPITVEWVWNEAMTEATASVTVPAGKTYDYQYYGDPTMAMTLNGEAYEYTPATGRNYPNTFSITNDGAEAATYELKIAYPQGHQMNPEAVEYLGGDVSLAEGNTSFYYYDYTAPEDGTVLVYITSITEGVTGDIIINNLTTGAQRSLTADGVDNNGLELSVEVSKDDVLRIQVIALPDANWVYPAADISWSGYFTAVPGSVNNPLNVEWVWNEDYTDATATVTVPAGETIYYAAVNGMMLTINDGEPYYMAGSMWNPAAPFSITNDGETDAEYALHIYYAEGDYNNPAVLVIGDNTATVNAGSNGYFYTYTATEDGTLSITMPEGNWTYAINNLTAGTYGDTQWSDSDPVVNPATVEVTAGDEIQIMVNTYDPTAFEAPAGTLTITAAFEPAVVAPEYNVVTSAYGLSLDAELVISSKFLLPEELMNDADAVIKIQFIDEVTEIKVADYVAEHPVDSKGRIKIEQSVKSPWMTHMVTVTITDGNGNVADYTDYFGDTHTGSYQFGAENYVKLMSVVGAGETTVNAVRALLTYGAYAQKYFSTTGVVNITEELATDILIKYGYEPVDISSFSSDLLTQEMTSEGDSFDGISIRNGTPNLDAAIFMTVQFNATGITEADMGNYTYKLSYMAGTTLIEEEITPTWDSRGRLVFVVLDIPAMFFDCMYSITITKTATGETYTGAYSVLAYMGLAFDTYEGVAGQEDYLNLLKAMYYYNQAANTHFGV